MAKPSPAGEPGAAPEPGEAAAQIHRATEVMREQRGLIASFLETADEVTRESHALSTISRGVSEGIANAHDRIGQGTAAVAASVQHIDEIMGQYDLLSQKVAQLSELTSSISAIVSFLQSISSQTNLLALNAAIEAARAGEHGKGFGVVASEVKNLSKESTEATRQVEETVNKILSELKDIERTSAQGLDSARDGHQQVSRSQSIFGELAELVNGIYAQRSRLEQTAGRLEKGSEQARSLGTPIAENRKVIAQGLDAAAALVPKRPG